MGAWCCCVCHSSLVGDSYAALQRGDLAEANRLAGQPAFNVPSWAPVDDPLEAAVASGCRCVKNHAPALLTRPKPPYLPPKNWKPTDDGDTD